MFTALFTSMIPGRMEGFIFIRKTMKQMFSLLILLVMSVKLCLVGRSTVSFLLLVLEV